MAVSLKHKFVSGIADGVDATKVRKTNWNDEHDLVLGTGKVLGRSTAGTGAVEELTATTTGLALLAAADTAAARTAAGFTKSVVDTAYVEYKTNADLTTAIPADDTIPQVTEGTQVLSQAITPKATTNRIKVHISGVGATAAADLLTVAVFRNGGANAIASIGITSTGSIMPLSLLFEDSPGSVSAQTYTVRVGASTQVTRLNGTTAARYMGGTIPFAMSLTELTP